MSTRSNITSYFDNILSSIKNMEQGAKIFGQLDSIAEEVGQLEKYVKSSFATLDNQFQAHIQKINLLSSLIEFQRKIVRFKTPEEMAEAVFTYIRENIDFDHALIYLKVDSEQKEVNLLSADASQVEKYKTFLSDEKSLQKLMNIVQDKDLGVLLSNIHQFQADQMPWTVLEAKSAIVFPLRMQGNFLGFGVLTRSDQPLLLNHLSFVNLILGLLSLLLFQHFYFFYLKRRISNQVKLQKVMEEYKYVEYFEKGPIKIFSLDQDGFVLHANNAGLQSFRENKEAVIGEQFLSFISPNRRQEFENHLNQLGGGDFIHFTAPLRLGEDDIQIWKFYLTRLEFQDGTDVRSVFAVDITDHHVKEEQASFKKMMAGIEQFSDKMNGTLNSLLTVLVPNVSLIKSHLPAEHNLQKYLSTMDRSLENTSSLVKNFLNYGQTEIEKPVKLNINKLIVDTIHTYKDNYPRNLEVTFSLDPVIPPLENYPRRLQKLIQVFVQNSAEALDGKGQITIASRLVQLRKDGVLKPQLVYLSAGSYVELIFEDDGPGTGEASLEDVLMPFYTTKIKNEGQGLGLYIAYKIVNDLGGEIHLTSIPDESTRFYVYIPITGIPELKQAIANTVPAPVFTAAPSQAILVIDDELHIRSTLQELFELKGYRVLTAENGQEGVDVFRTHGDEIDLVILDMMMPVMDGKSAFKKIRELKSDQKIIIISGYSNRDDLEEILSNGALAFMSKPFQINDVIKRVEAVLEGE